MGGLGEDFCSNSCFQRLPSSESDFDDVPEQLLTCDTSRDEVGHLFPPNDLGKNSCFQRLPSSESDLDDVSEQLRACDTSRDEPDHLFPSSGLGKDSCFQRLPSSESDDVSEQLLACETSRNQLVQLIPLIPKAVWDDIDDIINNCYIDTTTTTTTKQQSRKLVRKRKYRAVCVGTQLDCSYGLDKKGMKAKLEFLKPKTYQCDYCPADMLNVHVYIRHLKRHREAELRHCKSRCNSCGKLFNDIIETKWHQTRCLRRAIVGSL